MIVVVIAIILGIMFIAVFALNRSEKSNDSHDHDHSRCNCEHHRHDKNDKAGGS